jgi:hypothetical protein
MQQQWPGKRAIVLSSPQGKKPRNRRGQDSLEARAVWSRDWAGWSNVTTQVTGWGGLKPGILHIHIVAQQWQRGNLHGRNETCYKLKSPACSETNLSLNTYSAKWP